jgi:multidrug efflux pump subunit AcrA (membrane-fusion protein)
MITGVLRLVLIGVPLLFAVLMSSSCYAVEMNRASDQDRKILFWIDPMVPGSHFEHGGKSPFMDMDLVPVYESDPSVIVMNSNEAANLPVQTAKVSKQELSQSIRTVAVINYDERNIQDITVRVNARISRYYYPIHEGFLVKKGQPLFELQSPEIYQYLSDYLNLVSNSDKLRAVSTDTLHIMQQSKTTLLWRGIPQDTIEDVIKSSKATDRFIVRAPVTGIVLKRFVQQGSLVNAGVKTGQFTTYGTPVARIADISFVYADAQLFSGDLTKVKTGTPCVVTLQGSNGESFDAKVSYVYPALKDNARYGIARIALNNPSLALKPGMFADVQLHLPADDPSLTVPRDAVVEKGDEKWVFVKIDSRHFQKRQVIAGEPKGDLVPVSRGLDGGEEVVTGGAVFFLNAALVMKQPVANQSAQMQQ